jgi:ribosomal protein L37E
MHTTCEHCGNRFYEHKGMVSAFLVNDTTLLCDRCYLTMYSREQSKNSGSSDWKAEPIFLRWTEYRRQESQ